MTHIPTQEADDQRVYRIARELGISLEEAAVTCAGFELAFSDDRMRRAIFEIIDQLDYEAYNKGEPLAMILSYAVELGMDGIHVSRHANDIPPGQVVSLTPTNRAMIFVKIKDNFPTQKFLGPLIVNRPEWEFASVSRESEFDRDTSERHFGRDSFGTDISNGLSPSRSTKPVICLGPIRLKFNERFPCVSATKSSSQPAGLQAGNLAFQSKALNPHHHLPPWAALQAGMPAVQSTSGLSPPFTSENLGHSKSERCPCGPWLYT